MWRICVSITLGGVRFGDGYGWTRDAGYGMGRVGVLGTPAGW